MTSRLGITATTVLALALAACSGGDPAPTASSESPAPAATSVMGDAGVVLDGIPLSNVLYGPECSYQPDGSLYGEVEAASEDGARYAVLTFSLPALDVPGGVATFGLDIGAPLQAASWDGTTATFADTLVVTVGDGVVSGSGTYFEVGPDLHTDVQFTMPCASAGDAPTTEYVAAALDICTVLVAANLPPVPSYLDAYWDNGTVANWVDTESGYEIADCSWQQVTTDGDSAGNALDVIFYPTGTEQANADYVENPDPLGALEQRAEVVGDVVLWFQLGSDKPLKAWVPVDGGYVLVSTIIEDWDADTMVDFTHTAAAAVSSGLG